MDTESTLAEHITESLLAGAPVHAAWGECDCGAADVGSDAHYVDCAIGRLTTVLGGERAGVWINEHAKDL